MRKPKSDKKLKQAPRKRKQGGSFYYAVIMVLLFLGVYFVGKVFIKNFHFYNVKDAAWKVQDEAKLGYACKDVEYWFKSNLPRKPKLSDIELLSQEAPRQFTNYRFEFIAIESKNVKFLNIEKVTINFKIYGVKQAITLTVDS